MSKQFEILLFLFLILISGTWALFLGRDIGWDMLDYHFYNGYAFIKNRYFYDLAPAMVQSYLNPFFDILNYYILSQKTFIAIFLQGAITGISAFILFKISLIMFEECKEKYLKTFYILCTMIIGLTGAANVSTLGLTSNDNKMALMVLLAIFFTTKALQTYKPKTQYKWILASGIIMGLVTGFKLVAGCYTIGLGIALLCTKSFDKNQFKLCAIYGGGVLLGFLLSNGAWMYFLYHNFDSPLFPYYNNFFHSPYIGYISFKDPSYYPKDYFTWPFHFAFTKNYLFADDDTYMRSAILAIIYVLFIAFLLKAIYLHYIKNDNSNNPSAIKNPINIIWRFLILWFFASYIIWFFSFTIYRYAVPLELISGLLIIFFIRKLFSKYLAANTLLLAITIFLICSSTYQGFGKVPLNFTKKNLMENYFVIDNLPHLPSKSVVFIDAPNAFLIPFFPEDTKFIGSTYVLNYNIFTENDPSRPIFYQQAVKMLQDSAITPTYVLFCKRHYDKFQKESFHELKIMKGQCQEFHVNLEGDCDGIMEICQIKALFSK